MIGLHFDASELDQLGRAFQRLPIDIKLKAFNRAMGRMRDRARTMIVRLSAERTDLPIGKVRERTTARYNPGSAEIEVRERSGWIPLSALGPKQGAKGVKVRGRKMIAHAFVLKSGSKAVMIREQGGDGRYPIKELFGPNPAHDVINNPEEFQDLLVDLIEQELAPRVLHEIERLIPGCPPSSKGVAGRQHPTPRGKGPYPSSDPLRQRHTPGSCQSETKFEA